ncbi:hypothetical protein [Sedimentisphaera salicampi]|uniref:Uncharacterized protein n=1 Tax=Sedimentisphaera salicampi TaxID=1941349 RepID=A0A1W6LJI8_9BACT|nr:hypothetical protein [Sedimentisphaera salicampi]ARN55904.1 hypothetical protein STSP1_00271 [Sedimentisphaera salicampi]
MADWNIKKPEGVCSICGREFETDEEFYAGLVDGQEGFERIDTCIGCWQEKKPRTFYFWKTKMPQPEEKGKQKFLNDETMLEFLEKLEQSEEPEKINFRFVLMLVLVRKRILRYKDTFSRDGKDYWRLKITGQDKMVEVLDPHIGEEQIEKLSENIGDIMLLEDE